MNFSTIEKKINELVYVFQKNNKKNSQIFFKFFFTTYYRVIKNYFFSIFKNFKRSQQFTKNRYDRIWSDDKIQEMYNSENYTSQQIFTYKKKSFLAPESMQSRVFQTIHAETVTQLDPQSILEVGCGQGFHLKLLSSLFPQKKFYGIDQSVSGINFANQKIKNLKLTKDITYPLGYNYLDNNGDNLSYEVQDAKKLKFDNNSIDFIYTNLALEQMDNIKFEVLSEIKRVSKKYVLLIEPFKNLNNTGAKFFHHRSKKYFSLNYNELEDANFKILNIIDKIPHKISLGAGALLLEKK